MELKKPRVNKKLKKSVKRLSKNDSKGKKNFVSINTSENIISPISKNNFKKMKKQSLSKTNSSEINSKLSKNNLKDIKAKTISELSENNVKEKKNEHKLDLGLNLKLSKNGLNKTKKKSLGIQKQKQTNIKLTDINSKKKKDKIISVINTPEANSNFNKTIFKKSDKTSTKKANKKSISLKESDSSTNGLKLNKQKLLKVNNTDELISVTKKSSKNLAKKDSVSASTKFSKANSIKNKYALKIVKKQSKKAKNDEDVNQLKKQNSIINKTEDICNIKSSKKDIKKNKSISKIDSIIDKNISKILAKQAAEQKKLNSQDIHEQEYPKLITLLGDDLPGGQPDQNKIKNNISISDNNSVKVNTKKSKKKSVKNGKVVLPERKEHNNEFKKPINKEFVSQSRKRKLTSNTSEDLSTTKSCKKLKAQLKNVEKVKANNEIRSIKSKKRKSKADKEEKFKVLTKSSLTKDQIIKYVKGLFTIVESEEHKKKSLFSSDKPPILLILNCIKVPQQPLHQMRMILPHSMISSDDDVALFVKDIKRGRKRDSEETIRHYEELLRNNGISQIKAVISINQVKTEYRQYEMRRRLLSNYDYFLAEGKIVGHMAHLLGKTFRLRRKLPTSISFETKNLKSEFDIALRKTIMQMHSNGDSFTVQVGTCSMDIGKIADNILSIIQKLDKNFPGGWENIRCLRLKVPLSMAIPIYMSFKSRNDVKVPVVAPKRPKAYRDVEGELSTFTDNVNVTVAPDGSVKVQKIDEDSDNENNKTEDEDSIEDEAEQNEVNDLINTESEEESS